MRRGKAAAGDFLPPSLKPCHVDILAARCEFYQLSKPAKKDLRLGTSRRLHCDDRGKMTGPFAFQKIFVIARGDNMAAKRVSFVDPVFIQQYLVFAPATEAAVQDV